MLNALALEGSTVDIGSVLSSGFTEAVGTVMSAMGTILPIGLGLFGAFFAVRKGIQIFKSVTGK